MEGSIKEIDELSLQYVKARAEYEAKKTAASEAYKEVEKLEFDLLDKLSKAGKNQWRMDGVGLFSVKTTMNVTTPKTLENKLALFDYVMSKYGKEVVADKFAMHSKSLQGFYNEELQASSDPSLFVLPGIDAPTASQSLSFRKA